VQEFFTALALLGAFIVTCIAFMLGGNANRRGVSSDKDSARAIDTGLEQSKVGLERGKERIERSEERIESGKENIDSSIRRLKDAIAILDSAKKRNDDMAGK